MKTYLILLLFLVLTSSCRKKPQTWQVKEQLLNEAVYASGQMMPTEYYFLKSIDANTLLKLLVKEGSNVKQAQPLAILGTLAETSQVEILKKQVSIAKYNAANHSALLNELSNKIQYAEQKYRQDSLNNSRYDELSRIKAVSQKDAEQAKINVQSSFNDYQNLRQQYRSMSTELKDKALTAGQNLAQASQLKQRNILTSPVDGAVYHINVEEGELVKPNEPILMVGSPKSFKLELLVDERDITKIKIGQKVLFETDAFQGQHFAAVINKINPVSQKETRSFSVEATVKADKKFFPQSTVEANILIREKSKVLVMPTDYLIGSDSVQLKHGKDIQKIKIFPGTRNGKLLEVRNGIHAGDILIKPDRP